MDKLTKSQRHKCMSAIRSKDTKPELLVRRFLFSRGFRYRLCHPRLPGHPDIVMRKYRTVIFINGCFWHGHENCSMFRMPKTNTEFWEAKIERNRERDKNILKRLAEMRWHSITIWECQLKPSVRQQTFESLEYTLSSIYLADHTHKRYIMPDSDMMMAAEEETCGNYNNRKEDDKDTPTGDKR